MMDEFNGLEEELRRRSREKSVRRGRLALQVLSHRRWMQEGSRLHS